MAHTDVRPGEGSRGDADDQPAGEVSTEGIPRQLRRRRAASWRYESLADGRRDPLDPHKVADWTDDEVASWAAAAAHLRSAGLFGGWQVPASVRVVWYRRRSCACRGAA